MSAMELGHQEIILLRGVSPLSFVTFLTVENPVISNTEEDTWKAPNTFGSRDMEDLGL